MVQSLGRGLFITAFVAFLAAGLCSTRLRVIEKEGDISHQRPPHLLRAGKRRSFDAYSKETRRRSGASWRPTTQDLVPSPGPTSPIPRRPRRLFRRPGSPFSKACRGSRDGRLSRHGSSGSSL